MASEGLCTWRPRGSSRASVCTRRGPLRRPLHGLRWPVRRPLHWLRGPPRRPLHWPRRPVPSQRGLPYVQAPMAVRRLLVFYWLLVGPFLRCRGLVSFTRDVWRRLSDRACTLVRACAFVLATSRFPQRVRNSLWLKLDLLSVYETATPGEEATWKKLPVTSSPHLRCHDGTSDGASFVFSLVPGCADAAGGTGAVGFGGPYSSPCCRAGKKWRQPPKGGAEAGTRPPPGSGLRSCHWVSRLCGNPGRACLDQGGQGGEDTRALQLQGHLGRACLDSRDCGGGGAKARGSRGQRSGQPTRQGPQRSQGQEGIRGQLSSTRRQAPGYTTGCGDQCHTVPRTPMEWEGEALDPDSTSSGRQRCRHQPRQQYRSAGIQAAWRPHQHSEH